MKRFFTLLAVVLFSFVTTQTFAKQRPKIVIPKPYPTHPIAPVVAVVLPFAILYDIQRRTNCQGDVLGLGGPGFTTPITPASGNVMIPAVSRSACAAAPK